MLFGLPGLSEFEDPLMITARRYHDLHYAVQDHYDHCDELKRTQEDDANRVAIGLDASCGYVLRLEMRMRGRHAESGYTLIQTGYGLHSPIVRVCRRSNAEAWMAVSFNMQKASKELLRLCKMVGLQVEGQRYALSDLGSNVTFGKCCEIMLYGFMVRPQT